MLNQTYVKIFNIVFIIEMLKITVPINLNKTYFLCKKCARTKICRAPLKKLDIFLHLIEKKINK